MSYRNENFRVYFVSSEFVVPTKHENEIINKQNIKRMYALTSLLVEVDGYQDDDHECFRGCL